MRALLAFLALLGAAQAKTERFGIFVGHNLGRDREPLRFAERDAERIAAIFRELGGMAPANTRVLRAADRASLDRAFGELEGLSRRLPPGVDAVFFLYFSGHGDERSLIMGGEALPLDSLKARFDAFPAKLRIGMFDACQSGAITRIKGAKVVEPFVHLRGVNGEGNIYITSSGNDENSQEADHLEASFFTHHLASGLRGAADASGDRKVTVMEAYNYAFNHTVAETGGTRGGTQHPNARFRMDMEGDIVLTDVASGASAIRFDKGCRGEFLILDRDASVIAEVNKDVRSEVVVAVDPGKYTVFRKEAGILRKAEVELRREAETRFDEKDMVLVRGAPGKVKGWADRAGREPAAFRRPPAPPSWLGLSLGIHFDDGTGLLGGIRSNPYGPVAFHLNYGFIRAEHGGGRMHEAGGGLEVFGGFTDWLELYGLASFHWGRANDGFAYIQETVRYTCLDTEGTTGECSYRREAWWRYYQDMRTFSLDLGARIVLHRRLAVKMRTGILHSNRMVDLGSVERIPGLQAQHFGMGAEICLW